MSQVAKLKAAIAKYTNLIQLGCKKYIINLLDAEEQLEILEKEQNMKPTHQQLWNSIQNGEWVQKSKVIYDQDWDDNRSVIETRVTWYEHPVWGKRESLFCEAPDARLERQRLSAIADARQKLFLSEVERLKAQPIPQYSKSAYLLADEFWSENQTWIEYQDANSDISDEEISQLARNYVLSEAWASAYDAEKNAEWEEIRKKQQQEYERQKNDPAKDFTAYVADRKSKNLPRLSWDKWVKLVQVK